ncbi:MAG: hypothetical protein Q8O79_02055 [Pseudomonadota bacterium]|nr:hypothetical protein [Pseudomonadota bacterium]
MLDSDRDIIGKIDAMLGKRDADVLSDKSTLSDDFPMLTEVIEEAGDVAWKGGDRRGAGLASDGRRLSGRRIEQRRQSHAADSNLPVINDEVERLLAAMEHRLTDLFIRQQLRMEEALRKVIRDELGGDEDAKS